MSEPRAPKLFFKHIIRKVFFEDWLIKLVALGVTFALWLGVTGLSTPTTTRLTGIPLSLRFSSDVVVTNSPVDEIDVVISGDNRKIAQINKNDLVASVDLTSIQPGDRLIQLTPENVLLDLPLGVRLDEVTPGRMIVRIEAVDVKEVPVKVETTGKLPEGLELYSQTVVPARVRIRGPQSYTKDLAQILTEKIDLTDRREDFIARQTPLSVDNSNAALLDSVVDVLFRIGEKRIERTFSVPVADGSGKKVAVVLYGGRTLLTDLKPNDISVEIVKNAAGVDTPQVTLPAALQDVIEIRRARIS
ncbi:MAG TPA: CdaR family protein [Pyrinomonadaceae bacterium]|nr:CdaR family protein [Pyrinomonadaceae bacterium]